GVRLWEAPREAAGAGTQGFGNLLALRLEWRSHRLATAAAACGLCAHPLHGVGLLVRVAFFFPWVAVKVIAVDLPETRSVDFQELERANPLGALPEVELRHDEPAVASVLRREG